MKPGERDKERKRLALTIWLLLYSFGFISELSAGFKQSQQREELSISDVGFSVMGRTISLAYGRTQDQAYNVFFSDEPIIFEVSLSNGTNQLVPISSKDGRWSNFISVTLYKDSVLIPSNEATLMSVTPEIKSPPNSQTVRDLSLLYPREQIQTDARLKLRGSVRLPVGIYKLELWLNPSRLGDKFPYPNRKIPAIISFEVREVKSRADQLDYYMRQAIRSRWNKEYERALEFLNKMLALNRNSIPAHIELGRLHCDQGKVEEAVRLFEKAIKIIETNADPEHYIVSMRTNPDDAIGFLKGLIHLCKTQPRSGSHSK
uniref:Tetratricopeptide repeat protein n=1 Tax=Oscillatoriales cyanobacterium SpSt-418 TaxID=2282169 RepID=A0A7C3PGW1_9CYAN